MSPPKSPQQSPTQDKFGDGSPSNPTQTRRKAISSPSKTTSIIEGILGFFQKLGLLVWKNLIMRKRSWFLTCVEITYFSISFLILMDIASLIAASSHVQNHNIPEEEFHNNSEDGLIGPLKSGLEQKGSFIAYSPSGEKADEIIAKVRERLGTIHENSHYRSLPEANNTNETAPATDAKKFRGFPSEQAVIKQFEDPNIVIKREYGDPIHLLFGAIIFEGLSGNGPITYKIRLTDQDFKTNLLFKDPDEDEGGSGGRNQYEESAFIGLQILVEKAVAKVIFGQDLDYASHSFPHVTQRKGNGFAIQQFVEGGISPFMVMQMMFMVPILVPGIIGEGATGVRELLKLNGLPGWVQWMGWMINSMIAFSIPVTFYTFALCITKLPVLFPVDSDTPYARAIVVESDPSVWWTVFFLYGMAGTAFCFFISSMFSNGAMGTVVAILFWIVSYFACKFTILMFFKRISFGTKLALGLMPNNGFHLALQVMLHFEINGEGARWINLAEPISSTDPFSVFIAMLMLIVDTLVYTLLAIYLENVWPSKYGVRKPWYYLFLCGWNFKKRSVAPAVDSGEVMQNEGFEPEPTDIPVGIEIINLRKTFGRKRAVDGVSAKMYEGEIFALLGHNGAGKTTTISVLTGMTAPTSGTAIINSLDIRSDMERVRESLGFCPQEDMLFNKLTVMEHLRFFGQLKGMTGKQAKREGRELLELLRLTEKEKVLAKKLSGGQKRKLSLGIALTGGAKTIVLDEPTSGMDPEARRALWDCLLSIRKEKTILLTTHFMEEADVLGDRIGIMAEGRMQCCGTPAFLKKFYGTGYLLKVIISSKSDPKQVLSLVQSQVPGAEIKSTYASNASEVLITLPGETTTATLATMFTQLSSKKDALGIEGVGLSQTTMDDVFVRVGELADKLKLTGTPSAVPSKADDLGKPKEAESKNETNENGPAEEKPVEAELSVPKRTFRDRIRQQAWALVVKKFIYSLHTYGLLTIQLPLPIIITLLILLLSNYMYTHQPEQLPPPLKISLSSYENPVALYSLPAEDERHFKSVVGPSAQKALDNSISKSILKQSNESYIIGIEVGPNNVTTAMYNPAPFHSIPLAINVMTNYLLEKAKPGANHRIHLVNHPLSSKTKDLLALLPRPKIVGNALALMIMALIMIALIMCTSTFVVFPVEERISKAKQLQLMTGVSPITYWATCFLCDYLLILITITLMVIIFPIFDSFKIYWTLEGLIALFLILAVFSFSAIALAYLISFKAGTPTGGFAFCVVIHLLSGILLAFISTFMSEEFQVSKMCVRWISRLISPAYSAAMSIHRFALIASHNGKCSLLSEEARDGSVCHSHRYYEYVSCCKDLKCSRAYFEWSYEWRSGGPADGGSGAMLCEGENGTTTAPGILQQVFWVGFSGFVYLFIIILLEYCRTVSGVLKPKSKKRNFLQAKIVPKSINDEDVMEESQRVSGMVNSRAFQDALIVDSLSKNFGNFAAVAGVSFGVHHGECFGLLGVNGAGKTTTFRMLTGDESRSSGNAYAFGNTLDMNRSKFFANIGYCPQFDGIIGELSGRQMLQLFARLRGVPNVMVGVEADKWLEKLGLEESGTVQCRNYSGGMKRRLCAGMAMIGDPPLLLLDEPTSGVDPVSRRRFWVVLESLKQSGQSIILTSHSMEECEALCSRLAIMVNGQLQCFGGVQHLKAKYGQAYKLSVTVSKSVEPELMKREEELSNEIIAKFEPCLLKDKHQGVMVYDIQNISIPYSTIFQSMEELKNKYEGILQDYTVSETSLEDVFLSFARAQYGERKAQLSCCQKLCSCSCCC